MSRRKSNAPDLDVPESIPEKKKKYFVSDVLETYEEEFDWAEESEASEEDANEDVISVRKTDFKSLMNMVLQMNSEITSMRKELLKLVANQSDRDKIYQRDLQMIKWRLPQQNEKIKWPLTSYEGFLQMEKRIQEDVLFKTNLKPQIIAKKGMPLRSLFSADILVKFSLHPKRLKRQLEHSPLFRFVARSWAEGPQDAKRVLEAIGVEVESTSKARTNLGKAEPSSDIEEYPAQEDEEDEKDGAIARNVQDSDSDDSDCGYVAVYHGMAKHFPLHGQVGLDRLVAKLKSPTFELALVKYFTNGRSEFGDDLTHRSRLFRRFFDESMLADYKKMPDIKKCPILNLLMSAWISGGMVEKAYWSFVRRELNLYMQREKNRRNYQEFKARRDGLQAAGHDKISWRGNQSTTKQQE